MRRFGEVCIQAIRLSCGSRPSLKFDIGLIGPPHRASPVFPVGEYLLAKRERAL